jgi:hypothetical protein
VPFFIACGMSIERAAEKMKIDTSIVYGQYINVTSSVTYYLYEDKSTTVTIPNSPESLAKPITRACFVDLYSQLRDKPKLNRIAYLPRLLYPNLLSREIAKKWIKIATKIKMLPDYVRPIHFDSTFVLDLSKVKEHANLLYIYLATLRFIEEEPHFVRSAVHLIRKHKMDPYAAIAFTAALCINHSGHGFLMTRPYYSSPFPISSLKVPINWAIGLRRFIDNPDKYRKPDTRFCCTETLRYICGITNSFSIDDYNSPAVVKAIYSDSDAEAKECLSESGLI